MQTEFRVSPNDSDAVREAAADLGIEIVEMEEVRGAGGEAWTLFSTLAGDSFVQGAFFGYLLSRGICIERTKDGKVIVTIDSLKTLMEWIDKFR